MSDKIAFVVIFGQSAPEIYRDLAPYFKIYSYPKLHDVLLDLDMLLKDLKFNILFSPACASYDEFLNFEDRGKLFSTSIRKFLNP